MKPIITEYDLVYAAGFLDGEGCITIHAKGNGTLCRRINVTNTNLMILTWYQDVFGGNVYLKKRSKGHPFKSYLPCYEWEIYGKKAETFLKQINPFLRIKKVKRISIYPPRPKNEFENVK